MGTQLLVIAINHQPLIKVSRKDTLICTCDYCSKRVLGVAEYFGSHDINICAEVEA